MSILSDSPAFRSRLRRVRREIYGDLDGGVPRLAEALGIPAREWEGYEAGATMSGSLLVELVRLTRIDPVWLLTGEGEPYLRLARLG